MTFMPQFPFQQSFHLPLTTKSPSQFHRLMIHPLKIHQNQPHSKSTIACFHSGSHVTSPTAPFFLQSDPRYLTLFLQTLRSSPMTLSHGIISVTSPTITVQPFFVLRSFQPDQSQRILSTHKFQSILLANHVLHATTSIASVWQT